MGYTPIFFILAMDLHALLDKTLTGLGYELVDLDFPSRGRLLRVLIDKPEKEGGVDIDDCALVSNHLSRLFEVEGVDYERLEISSPGLDRPLKKAADFERFVGHRVRLRLFAPVDARRNFQGIILNFEGGLLTLRPTEGGADEKSAQDQPGIDISLDFDNIEKARLLPDFRAAPGKTGKRRGR